jgi:RNase P protein component
VRNRIRRRLRAAIAAVNVPLTSGFYLISADPAAATMPYLQLVAALSAAIDRLAPSSE